MELPFKSISILGMGLMGGSLCKGVLEAYFEEKNKGPLDIKIYDPSPHRFKAPHLEYLEDPAEAVLGAELIVLGCPLGAMKDLLVQISNSLSEGALIMDLGSVKGQVSSWMKEHLPSHVSWVGGHPMCGSERSGVGFARADLFKDATFFLTEGHLRKNGDRRRIEQLLKLLGARPQWCQEAEHDKNVAFTSHLPHISAAILVNSLEEGSIRELEPFMAGGFKDSTRVAAANPSLWRDIISCNKEEILKALEAYEIQLKSVKTLLSQSDEAGLEAFLEKASNCRRRLF